MSSSITSLPIALTNFLQEGLDRPGAATSADMPGSTLSDASGVTLSRQPKLEDMIKHVGRTEYLYVICDALQRWVMEITVELDDNFALRGTDSRLESIADSGYSWPDDPTVDCHSLVPFPLLLRVAYASPHPFC
jgi:hypothetical protein